MKIKPDVVLLETRDRRVEEQNEEQKGNDTSGQSGDERCELHFFHFIMAQFITIRTSALEIANRTW